MTQGSRLEGSGEPARPVLEEEVTGEFARLLAQLGVEEKPAKVVAFLAGRGEGRSADIEEACSMRQPEVSQATKELRQKGWVIAKREKKPGKGRPVNNYRLKVSLPDIVNEVEGTKREQINQELARLERLRSLVRRADR